MLRKLIVLLVVLGILSVPLGATITVPFTFTPFTTISSSQVNANFSAVATNALDKRGDSMTGTLVTQAVTPDVTTTRSIGTSLLKYVDGWFSGTVNAANLALAGTLTGATTGAFSSNVTIGGTLGVTGVTTLSNNLSVNGTSTLTGAVTSATSLSQTGSFVATTTTLTGFQNFLPSTNNTLDVGVVGQAWRDGNFTRDLRYGRLPIGPAQFNAGNTGAAITLNFGNNGPIQLVTRNASTTITLASPPAAGFFTVLLLHDATGNAYTMAFSPAVKFPNGTPPSWSNTTGALDILTLYWDGGSWYGVGQVAFA